MIERWYQRFLFSNSKQAAQQPVERVESVLMPNSVDSQVIASEQVKQLSFFVNPDMPPGVGMVGL